MGGRVLIIDDSSTIRFITRVYLSGLGVEVREASHGRDGLAAIDAGGIDLVIADLTMPEMDGLEFVRQLRARPDPRQSQIPVILMTMEQAPGLREKLLAAGANRFLTKPVTNEVLRAAVLAYLPQAGGTNPEGGAKS
jgi:two-component system chemotaxis response regulator CheY